LQPVAKRGAHWSKIGISQIDEAVSHAGIHY
jgi:hypothetical protein